jgi:hypothetical protein
MTPTKAATTSLLLAYLTLASAILILVAVTIAICLLPEEEEALMLGRREESLHWTRRGLQSKTDSNVK